MKNTISIYYWAEQQENGLRGYKNLNQFKNKLTEDYQPTIHARPGDLGGGLYEFFVNFYSNLTLEEVVKFIGSGMAYDLIKEGTKSFIIRPFLNAMNQLFEENKEIGPDVTEFKITFEDSILRISKINRVSFMPAFEKIILTLAANYSKMILESGERPYEIRIPVAEDVTDNRIFRFREFLSVDEPIPEINSDSYLKYWGVCYDFARSFRVFDVQESRLLDDQFHFESEYWSEIDRRKK